MKLDDIAKEIREIVSNRQKELELSFTEEDHIYFMKDINGVRRSDFPSVSSVLKKFYTEFPTEQAAYNKAKGDPYEQERLIAEWAASGTYATNMGSRVHYLLEKKVIEEYGSYKEVRQPIFDCDLTQIIKGDSMVSAGTNFLNLMRERGAVLLDTEMVLGDPEFGYTGQPDKFWLIMNKEQTEFGLIVTDWKTNKPKNFVANNFTAKMYKPFQQYHNTALGHYYVQLPLYAKLFLKMLKGSKYENLKLYGCIVVLLKDNSEYEEFRVPKDIITTVLDMNIQDYLLDVKK